MAHVLILEDDPALLALSRDILAADGYMVDVFVDPLHALIFLEDPKNDLPDVVLLDVMMPGMSGYELVGRLQANDRTRGVKLIVCTSKPLLSEAFDAMPGVKAFLAKPYNVGRLHRLVRQVIDGQVDESFRPPSR